MTDYVISDCNSWSEISFEFIPTIDDLQYLVIGSFPETKPLIVFNNNPLLFCSVGGDPIEHYAYYLIDDVRLYCLDCDTNSYCTLALPDAFTPNADGLNDEWKPLINTDCDADIDNYLLRIFNRWGEVVFTSHDKNETWKGMNNEIGTYVYYLQYDDKQRTQIKQGSVELIR
jgi:gliding motility-associated-like protein